MTDGIESYFIGFKTEKRLHKFLDNIMPKQPLWVVTVKQTSNSKQIKILVYAFPNN